MLKRKLYFILKDKLGDSKILHVMQLCNQVLFHWDDRMHMTHPGNEDEDKIYYVVRPSSKAEGLLSLYFNSGIAESQWALKRGYIPYIDYDTENCQYHVQRMIDGTTNAWEYYFEQPIHFTADEIKRKKNVILNGWSLKSHDGLVLTPEVAKENRLKKLCQDSYKVKPYIMERAKQLADQNMISGKTLGVFIRGTDYTALKPKGHYKQPTIEQVMEKIDDFLGKYSIEKIQLVTEDFSIFQKFKAKYGDILFSSDDSFVKNYSTEDYKESSFQNDPYERGLNYLIRLILLTKCDYLISSITNGSLFVLAERENEYKDCYLFELGKYD